MPQPSTTTFYERIKTWKSERITLTNIDALSLGWAIKNVCIALGLAAGYFIQIVEALTRAWLTSHMSLPIFSIVFAHASFAAI